MRLFGVILVIIIQATSFSQNTNSFDRFLDAFESQENPKEIPVSISLEILGDSIIKDEYNVQAVEAVKLFNFCDNIITLIKIHEYSPIESSDYYLIKFSRQGEILNYSYLGGIFIRPEGVSFHTNCEMINDSILEVYKTGGFSSEKYQYYLITSKNYEEMKPNPVLRPNNIASIKIIGINELREMSITELDIMRNEIFADHGYIFKTEKWESYFQQQYWYTPLYDDVNDKLTIIEIINIHNILIASKEKR